jgi:hypothetical protein
LEGREVLGVADEHLRELVGSAESVFFGRVVR